MTWSNKVTPCRDKIISNLVVARSSALDGSAMPEGWLCATSANLGLVIATASATFAESKATFEKSSDSKIILFLNFFRSSKVKRATLSVVAPENVSSISGFMFLSDLNSVLSEFFLIFSTRSYRNHRYQIGCRD